MIIKSIRILTDKPLASIRSHLFRGPENMSVRILRGCEADLDDFRRPAVTGGFTYAIRHFVVAPQFALTTDEYLAVVDDLAREFGFDPAVCVVILHEKPRAVPASPTHLHVLVPEVDPVTGGVLDNAYDYLRHEKLGRLAEWRHGHPLLEGYHLDAVLRRLKEEGHEDLCRALRAAYPLKSSVREAFKSNVAAKAKRVAGVDLALLKHSGRSAWNADPTPEGLAAWIAAEGLTLRPGDQPRTLVLTKDGVHIAALHRFLGLRKGPTSEELYHVPALVAAISAAPEHGNRDSRRDAVNPPSSRGGVPVPRPGKGTTDRPGGGASRHTVGDPTDARGCSGQSSGAALAPRPLDAPRVKQRTLAARLRVAMTDAAFDRLVQLREAASKVAVTTGEACVQWIEDSLAAVEAERARLIGPDDHLDEETERLAQCARTMKTLQKACEQELAEAKASMAKVEHETRPRAWWKWFTRNPDPNLHRKAQAALQGAESRFANAMEMVQDATRAEGRERQRVARLRQAARANVPQALAALERRAQVLRAFGHLVAADPLIAYGGAEAFEAWTVKNRTSLPVQLTPPQDETTHTAQGSPFR